MEFRTFFFPILKKNPNLQKKSLLKIGIFAQSTHTHKLHDDILLPLHIISRIKARTS